jgi:hypothetical protein
VDGSGWYEMKKNYEMLFLRTTNASLMGLEEIQLTVLDEVFCRGGFVQ